MNRGENRNPALVELILVLLFFSLSALVLVQVFVKAHLTSEESRTQTLGILKAQDVMEQWKEDFAAQAREGSVFNRFLSIRILDVYWKEYRDVLLACAMDSARQVRELLEAVYVSHKEWEPRIRAMLSSKKSQERELAVRVLKNWGVDSCREELENALAVEKSKKIR